MRSGALASDGEYRVEAVVVQVVDVKRGGFADAQTVEGEHAAQPVGVGAVAFGRGEQVVDLAAAERPRGDSRSTWGRRTHVIGV